MTRTAPEEWNLAANWHEQDVTNAEFVRTFMSAQFPGGALVRRLEAEVLGVAARNQRKIAPGSATTSSEAPLWIRNFEDLFGHFNGFEKVTFIHNIIFGLVTAVVIQELGERSADDATLYSRFLDTFHLLP